MIEEADGKARPGSFALALTNDEAPDVPSPLRDRFDSHAVLAGGLHGCSFRKADLRVRFRGTLCTTPAVRGKDRLEAPERPTSFEIAMRWTRSSRPRPPAARRPTTTANKSRRDPYTSICRSMTASPARLTSLSPAPPIGRSNSTFAARVTMHATAHSLPRTRPSPTRASGPQAGTNDSGRH